MANSKLPSPTSGPSVASYIVLCLVAGLVLVAVVYFLGLTLQGTGAAFRAALGLRPA